MDLPHTGSLNQTVELLRIETNLFNLYIQGKPYHPTVESMQLHRTNGGDWIDTSLHISSISNECIIEKISLFSPELGKLVPWQTGEKSYPLFFETQSYELVIEKKQPLPITFHHENINLRGSIKPLGQAILSGILNFQNEVGLTDLELRLNGHVIFQLQLEIFPSKMDYKQDYQMILNDVNQQIYNLSFDFLRKTYHLTGLKETRNQSLTEFFYDFTACVRSACSGRREDQVLPQLQTGKGNESCRGSKSQEDGEREYCLFNEKASFACSGREGRIHSC